jgi:hypothetical protein
MTERPEPITRPNGKVWRGRNPIRVETFVNHDEYESLVVLGTHDVEEATRRAQNSWCWNESELFYAEPLRTWWRLVPWDATGYGHDSTWIVDEERGTPCVVFAND